MLDFDCAVPVPATLQELDRAVQNYRSHDYQGQELYCYWQAIRDASLEQSQNLPEPDSDRDRVGGEESY